jgi:hypothetical protein
MNHPYDIDDDATIHLGEAGCDECDSVVGDCSRDGVIRGLIEHEEGLCRSCMSTEQRQQLLKEAGEYVL